MKAYSIYILSFFALLIVSSGCKKDLLLDNGGKLHFSTDTLTFDTVFSTLGSFTIGIKIFNEEDQKVNISSVRVEGGETSFFNLNVNGIPGNEVFDQVLAAKDSLYVFATVKIDPRNENNPYIITDRLIATMNGKEYSIPMIAYGQDAHYYIDTVIGHSITWLTDKPYVIMKNALVDSGATLTIPGGCRVYVHADSRLYVDSGTLKVMGTKTDSVVFQGDRLDRAYFGYEGYPGEWGGLYFTERSKDNELNWVVLKNGGNSTRLGNGVAQPATIQVNGDANVTAIPQLSLNHCIIENSFGYGILSFTGDIAAKNTLIHTTGQQAVGILQGGRYSFDNCSFVNYFPQKVAHTDQPTVAVLNYFDISTTEYVLGPLVASFRNCVIYGSLENELYADRRDPQGGDYALSFTNCLIQSKDALPEYVTQTGCIFNQDPKFVDAKAWNYRPADGSPLIGSGIVIPDLGTDLDDKTWMSPYSIGAYYQQ